MFLRLNPGTMHEIPVWLSIILFKELIELIYSLFIYHYRCIRVYEQMKIILNRQD